MPELNQLLPIAPANVSDDDLLLIYDNSATSNKAKSVTRGQLLAGVARDGGDHNFGVSEVEDLTATLGNVIQLTVTTSLTFDAAATLQKIYRQTGAVVAPTLADGVAGSVTFAIAGILTGDYLSMSFTSALPDGLTHQAFISASGVVTIRFYNSTAASIAGASYTARVTAMRFA